MRRVGPARAPMADTRYLVDTSVLGKSPSRSGWNTPRGAGTQRADVDLPADRPRSRLRIPSRDVADIMDERRVLPTAPIDASVMDRAVQVAGGLARIGPHRGVKPVDLVVAAAAEAAGRSVLHYDSEYDRIAAVTNPANRVDRSGRDPGLSPRRGPPCSTSTCCSREPSTRTANRVCRPLQLSTTLRDGGTRRPVGLRSRLRGPARTCRRGGPPV